MVHLLMFSNQLYSMISPYFCPSYFILFSAFRSTCCPFYLLFVNCIDRIIKNRFVYSQLLQRRILQKQFLVWQIIQHCQHGKKSRNTDWSTVFYKGKVVPFDFLFFQQTPPPKACQGSNRSEEGSNIGGNNRGIDCIRLCSSKKSREKNSPRNIVNQIRS